MGAAMQAQGHTQVVSRLVDYHLNPQAIADAPRWRVYEGRNVSIEYGASAQLLDGLRTLGHVITPAARDSSEFGRAQLIHRLDEGYLAASERRSDGQAVGF